MLSGYLSPGDGVIDLGANLGKYTGEYAKAVGPTGYVLAVEPDPVTVAKLRQAHGENPRVGIVEAAVFGHSDGLTFYRDGADPKRDSCWAENRIREGDSFTVASTTLDALAASVPNLKAIKVDVQGAECHVLDGAAETLQRDLVWAVELWPVGLTNAGRSLKELAGMFQAHGLVPIGKLAGWEEVCKLVARYAGHQATDVILRKPALPGKRE